MTDPVIPPARRADARRNIQRILDAALEELTLNPDASMEAVAQRAGVVRATIYVHFPTREALITAVTERAIESTREVIGNVDSEKDNPVEALTHIIRVAWDMLGRYHALVAINSQVDPAQLRALHDPVLRLLDPVLERGRVTGHFNPELPTNWMRTVVLELMHAASREVSNARIAHDRAEDLLVTSILGALGWRLNTTKEAHRWKS